MYEHNALGYWWGLALCLTKVRSSRARCPVTAFIWMFFFEVHVLCKYLGTLFSSQKHNGASPFTLNAC